MTINVPSGCTDLSNDAKSSILDELNIKTIKAIGTNALKQVYVFNAVPVFDKIGPKFAKSVNKVAQWIKSLSQEKIEQLIDAGSLKERVQGEIIEISKQDVEIRKTEVPGASVMIEGDFGVGIDTKLNQDLEYEGLVRELIHKVQLMRKEANFNIVDRVKIFYDTDKKLKDAITENLDYLKRETLAVAVNAGIQTGEIEKVLDVNGIQAKITLQRAKLTEF
jgi:isoleucyl-tRNA synthetase